MVMVATMTSMASTTMSSTSDQPSRCGDIHNRPARIDEIVAYFIFVSAAAGRISLGDRSEPVDGQGE
jgi:hypothetical protein